MEGWSTDLKGEAELCDDTPPPSKKKCLSLSLSQRPGVCALQNVTNCFAQPVEASALETAAKGEVPEKTEESTQ